MVNPLELVAEADINCESVKLFLLARNFEKLAEFCRAKSQAIDKRRNGKIDCAASLERVAEDRYSSLDDEWKW